MTSSAEGEGFEPSVRRNRTTVFETAEARTQVDGAIAIDGHGACACACALLTLSTPAPLLTRLTVRRDARGCGLATALLGVIIEALAARGERQLASATSAANLPSLRWHLARDFS